MKETNKINISSKAKKIRRILLLKTDKDLKSNTNKKSNIMINSKTTQEMNKIYNSYTILLSESAKIYSNYVTIISKIAPNKETLPSEKRRHLPRTNEELNLKVISSNSFESNYSIIHYIPRKKDLGKTKFKYKKKGSINYNEYYESNMSKENKTKENEVIKSTKLNKKNIIKLIDKKARLQLHIDLEDEYITKNVIKLRKYCDKLIKKRKKIKKSPKNRKKGDKRKTVFVSNFAIQKSLFGLKENNQEEKILNDDTLKRPNIKIMENKALPLNNLNNKKNKKEEKDEKGKIISDKKRKLRRVQTLNFRKKDKDFNLKFSQKTQIEMFPNEGIINQPKKKLNENIYSSKFTRPQKFVIINNNINNANIIIKKSKNKKNSLFETKKTANIEKTLVKSDNNSKENIKEKEKTNAINLRNSFKRNVKHTVKVYNHEFNRLNIYEDS